MFMKKEAKLQCHEDGIYAKRIRSVFGPCFVFVSFCNRLDGEERAGCFTLIVSLILVTVSVPHGAVS